MSDAYTCDRCDQEATLEQEGQYGLLHVSCGCRGRYVNVKEALPERWSA